jgi:hypothetical protein
MERDKKNKNMASDRNNKCMWYYSNDRRLQLKKSDFYCFGLSREIKELKIRLVPLNPLSSDLFLVL